MFKINAADGYDYYHYYDDDRDVLNDYGDVRDDIIILNTFERRAGQYQTGGFPVLRKRNHTRPCLMMILMMMVMPKMVMVTMITMMAVIHIQLCLIMILTKLYHLLIPKIPQNYPRGKEILQNSFKLYSLIFTISNTNFTISNINFTIPNTSFHDT